MLLLWVCGLLTTWTLYIARSAGCMAGERDWWSGFTVLLIVSDRVKRQCMNSFVKTVRRRSPHVEDQIRRNRVLAGNIVYLRACKKRKKKTICPQTNTATCKKRRKIKSKKYIFAVRFVFAYDIWPEKNRQKLRKIGIPLEG